MSPGKFRFEPVKDSGVTGRFEVTIYQKDNLEKSKLVHSKMRGDGYPEKNWDTFHKRLDTGVENLQKE